MNAKSDKPGVEENLREALLSLERSWQTEKALREEYEGLVQCLHILSSEENLPHLFRQLLIRLQPILGFHGARICDVREDGTATTIASTDAAPDSTVLPPTLIQSALQGRPVTVFSLDEVPGWSPATVLWHSALVMRLYQRSPAILLVCYHTKPRHFNRRHADFLRDLAPSVSQAVDQILTHSALVESEEKYRILVESAEDGIAILADNRLAYVNRSLTRITGYSEPELLDRAPFEALPPADAAQMTDLISRCAAHRLGSGEVVISRKNGPRIHLDLRASAILYNRKPALLLFLRDVSEKRQLEQRLLQAQKLESIGQLAAGVAHEINNPLGFVNSNSNTLKEYVGALRAMLAAYVAGGTPEELAARRKELDIDFILDDIDGLIRENAIGLERVTTIIKNLKDFARIDSDRAFAYANLNHAIENTLVIARNEVKYVADVVTEFTPLPEIYCNVGEIKQVLLNLIVNAAQSIRDQRRRDRGHIAIRTYEKNGAACCEIEDDGPGIPAEIQPRIFDPFFTTKDVGKGSGMGLNIAYDIVVNKHDGEIQVASTSGKGATFTVTLPVGAPPEDDRA